MALIQWEIWTCIASKSCSDL